MAEDIRRFRMDPFILEESVRFAGLSSRCSRLPSPWGFDSDFGVLTFDIVKSEWCPDPRLIVRTLDECAMYNEEPWEMQEGVLYCLTTPYIVTPVLAVRAVNRYPDPDYIAHLTVPIHATLFFPDLPA